jgi:hypothetical protein
MITIEATTEVVALTGFLLGLVICIAGLVGRYVEDSDAVFGLLGAMFGFLSILFALTLAYQAGVS